MQTDCLENKSKGLCVPVTPQEAKEVISPSTAEMHIEDSGSEISGQSDEEEPHLRQKREKAIAREIKNQEQKRLLEKPNYKQS